MRAMTRSPNETFLNEQRVARERHHASSRPLAITHSRIVLDLVGEVSRAVRSDLANLEVTHAHAGVAAIDMRVSARAGDPLSILAARVK